MSTSLDVRTQAPVRAHPGLGKALRWEARKLAHQARTRVVLLGVLVAPIPIAFVIHTQGRPPKDTLFGRFATTNGFALSLLILGYATQWLLPLLTAVVAGDIFASEDQHGTWKTVLTRSVGRGQVFAAKTLAALGFAVLTILVLSISTIAGSVLIGGHGQLTGLSGQLIAAPAALRLASVAWLSTIPPTIGFTGLALLLSVWSRNPAAGIAAPALLGMIMQLVGVIGGAEALRPFLLSTPYEAWHGLFVQPGFSGQILQGLITSGLWGMLTLAAAYALFARRDVTGG